MSSLPGERTIAMAADTSQQADADAAVQAAVDKFGGVDVLINNAGVAAQGDVTATSQEDFDHIIGVNVGGFFHMAKAAMPELVKTKGNIVQTSSVSGIGGDWGMFAYNTSKGAVTNMTRALALDAGKHGVRVNAINPTMTDTGMTKDMQDEETIAKFKEADPDAPDRPARGHRQGDAVPRQRRGGVRHRRQPARRWRPVGLQRPAGAMTMVKTVDIGRTGRPRSRRRVTASR